MAYTITTEKVRGFQPPWRTVLVITCKCGHTTRIRKNWNGPTPAGIIPRDPTCRHIAK